MTAHELRESFLTFFEQRGHTRLPSSSLLPDNDPTVLLTTAGMQQFKPYFLGQQDAEASLGTKCVTTVQKCFRTSDIEHVGDASHLTFFEMLGNFSFGDYFKEQAIDWAWEFLTSVLQIPPDRLWVTIFAGDERSPRDDEAGRLWEKYLPTARITALPASSNFWGPPGATGPCGPCTEIFYQLDPKSPGNPGTAENDFLEIWNLVFMAYNQDADRTLSPLPSKNVDTGMGLDRTLYVLNGQTSPYETDVFTTIIASIRGDKHFGVSEDLAHDERRLRIVSDHIRGAVFLLSDGVTFSNKDQGYILRRIVRRAADQYVSPDFSLAPVVRAVIAEYEQAYPDLKANESQIMQRLDEEIEQYRKILQQDVQAVLEKVRKHNSSTTADVTGPSARQLSADEVFTLYSTHGVSLDRLEREGFVFDTAGVEEKITAHQTLSRAGAEKKFGGHGLFDTDVDAKFTPEEIQRMTRMHTATHLLQAALREVLGPDVKQSGSDISPERFRFDFTFPRKLTDEEKTKVQDLVNAKVAADLPVTWKMEPYKQAIDEGALAFFRDKYPSEVKVYSIGNFSKELCGGPHVEHTAEIGTVSITGEQSVGSGLRRIKATVL